eukprot:Tbor_TRINITY_DN3276_c0_g1::TRINITY_DN3276_c0_g1_i1::g.23741::m.23741
MKEVHTSTGPQGGNTVAPYDIDRESRYQLLSEMTFKDSYTRNTHKEDLVLEMAENFRSQYVSLYPTRAPLLLSPYTECSCRKFISTFIRPTQINFDSFMDWHTTSQFVANYIRYEPLDDLEVLPTKLCSPTTVMQWQIGNCIEMSIVLASLLIGDGYNAFVCIGYASKAIYANDQTKVPWPDSLPEEINPDDIPDEERKPTSQFMTHLKERADLVSRFEIELNNKDHNTIMKDMNINLMKDDSSPNRDGESFETLNNTKHEPRLVHAWVMILPDKRKVEIPKPNLMKKLLLEGATQFKGTVSTSILHHSQLTAKIDTERKYISEPLFIEPSTGMMVLQSAADQYYTGIETVFNHENYYVNMRRSDEPPSKIRMDLRNLMSWERVFLKDPSNVVDEEPGVSEKRKSMIEATSNVGAHGDQVLDLPTSWADPITLSLAQYSNRFPGKKKTIHYSNAIVEMYAEYSEPDMRVLVVSIPSDVFNRDEVHIFFKHRSDLLRRRSIYPQALSELPKRIHDWFYPGRMLEGSHRVEGLRELILEPGVYRTMRFYWKSRDDGLSLRKESFFNETIPFPKKIQEYYKGRSNTHTEGMTPNTKPSVPAGAAVMEAAVISGGFGDFLEYRSATYDKPKESILGIGLQNSDDLSNGAPGLFRDTSYSYYRINPIKMSEKFSRNPAIPADEDVQKRVYIKPLNSDGEIWVRYHYRVNTITHGSRKYPKNFYHETDGAVNLYGASTGEHYGGEDGQEGRTTTLVLMAGQEKPQNSDILNELNFLVAKEAECLNEIRARAEECKFILAQLDRDQRDNKSSFSVYDTLRGRTDETDAEIAQRKAEEQRWMESRRDYLAPFIAKQENILKICKGDYLNIKLTSEMARKVRDEAIADLKDRLIERGHIMQSRLDKERDDLMRRQLAFQKNLESAEGTNDAEEFARFSKQSTWRIHILEERLSNYIKSSAEKYRQLADRLAHDPRLTELYPSDGADVQH